MFSYRQSVQSLIDKIKEFIKKEDTFDPQIIQEKCGAVPEITIRKRIQRFCRKSLGQIPV